MKKWFIILLIFIIIGIIVFFIVNQKEKYFNHIIIEDINILNTIKTKNYLDTIIYTGVKSLEIKDLIIVIKPLSKDNIENSSFDDNLELKAHIQGMNNTYIIWINPNESRNSYIEIISHELIHLKQYYTKELMIINNNIYWKNEKINIDDYTYEKRPWEVEAFSNQKELEKKMIEILYD
jgi:hypothetical protein